MGVVAERAHGPEGGLAVKAHGAEGVGAGELPQAGDGDGAGAAEGVDGIEGALAAGGLGDALGVGFGEALDETQAEAEGRATTVGTPCFSFSPSSLRP